MIISSNAQGMIITNNAENMILTWYLSGSWFGLL
jgi:hypothetical protein